MTSPLDMALQWAGPYPGNAAVGASASFPTQLNNVRGSPLTSITGTVAAYQGSNAQTQVTQVSTAPSVDLFGAAAGTADTSFASGVPAAGSGQDLANAIANAATFGGGSMGGVPGPAPAAVAQQTPAPQAQVNSPAWIGTVEGWLSTAAVEVGLAILAIGLIFFAVSGGSVSVIKNVTR